MKLSRFLDDILKTAVSQVAVLVLSLAVVKVMAVYLSPEHFGIFGTIKRWIGVLLPIISLNLGVGLARYIGAEKEKSSYYLNISLLFSGVLFALLLFFSIAFPRWLSVLLFTSPDYSRYVYLTYLYLVANIVNLLVYSYFRGQFEMKRANLVWVLFFLIPLIPALLPFIIKSWSDDRILEIYFIFSTVIGTAISMFYIRGHWSFKRMLNRIETPVKESKGFLKYSLSRIPAGFFIALVLGMPVFVAGHRISLIAAGYANIITQVIRLLSVVATPFNLVFLPKFSYLKSKDQDDNIKKSCHIVMDFIITFLPFIGIALFGLTRYILVILFDKKYLVDNLPESLAISILFSAFFIAYALIRGILDGLYDFPYVNIITLLGILVTAVFSLFIFQNNIYWITLSFCLGIMTIGLSSIAILLVKVKITPKFKTLFISAVISIGTFVLFHYCDKAVSTIHARGIIKMGILFSLRLVVSLAVLYFFWQKTLWFQELKKRIHRSQGNETHE